MKLIVFILSAVLAATTPVRAEGKGSMSGVLDDVGNQPSHGDNASTPGAGKSGRAATAKPGPSPTGIRPDKRLREEIRRIERKVAAMAKATPASLKPVKSMAEAERRVRGLQARLDTARENLVTLGREETARLANEEQRHAEARVKAEDAALLRRMRAEGESPGESPAALRRKAKELGASRKRRIHRRQDEARRDANQYRAYLAKETAALAKMRKPATRPAGEGG